MTLKGERRRGGNGSKWGLRFEDNAALPFVLRIPGATLSGFAFYLASEEEKASLIFNFPICCRKTLSCALSSRLEPGGTRAVFIWQNLW